MRRPWLDFYDSFSELLCWCEKELKSSRSTHNKGRYFCALSCRGIDRRSVTRLSVGLSELPCNARRSSTSRELALGKKRKRDSTSAFFLTFKFRTLEITAWQSSRLVVEFLSLSVLRWTKVMCLPTLIHCTIGKWKRCNAFWLILIFAAAVLRQFVLNFCIPARFFTEKSKWKERRKKATEKRNS